MRMQIDVKISDVLCILVVAIRKLSNTHKFIINHPIMYETFLQVMQVPVHYHAQTRQNIIINQNKKTFSAIAYSLSPSSTCPTPPLSLFFKCATHLVSSIANPSVSLSPVHHPPSLPLLCLTSVPLANVQRIIFSVRNFFQVFNFLYYSLTMTVTYKSIIYEPVRQDLKL